MCVGEKQVLDVCEAFDLELLRLFFYDLSNKGITIKRITDKTSDPWVQESPTLNEFGQKKKNKKQK